MTKLRLSKLLTTFLPVVASHRSAILPSHPSKRQSSIRFIGRDGVTNARFNNHSRHGSVLDSVVKSFRGGDDRATNADDINYIGEGSFDRQNPNVERGNDGGYQLSPQVPNPSSYQQQFASDSYGNNNEAFYDGYRDTVEDRLSAWRSQQQQYQESQSPEQAASAVDEQGRFKLFTTVSRVSVSFFFFILMWRTVHHYELADATFGPSGRIRGGIGAALLRTVIVTPLVVLFLGEMMGAILGLTGGGIGGGGASHATKKRLKGILNMHKGVELIMMMYNVFRLTFWPSRYVMREVYIGRTISNFLFLMQAQLYTKLSWDDVSKTSVEDGYVNYYPDSMGYDDDFASWQDAQGMSSHEYDHVSDRRAPPHTSSHTQGY